MTQQSDGETAGAIAETLGDLPLALAQAAAYIEATGLSLSAYLERLRRSLRRFCAGAKAAPIIRIQWQRPGNMAFEALQQTQPSAISLLRLCAFFAPDDIPACAAAEASVAAA